MATYCHSMSAVCPQSVYDLIHYDSHLVRTASVLPGSSSLANTQNSRHEDVALHDAGLRYNNLYLLVQALPISEILNGFDAAISF